MLFSLKLLFVNTALFIPDKMADENDKARQLIDSHGDNAQADTVHIITEIGLTLQMQDEIMAVMEKNKYVFQVSFKKLIEQCRE